MSDLSKTMQRCVNFMRDRGNTIHRHPGGFWAGANWNQWSGGSWFGTSTVEALVKRGVAEYTEWKDGRFPIKAELRHRGCESER